MIKQLYQTGVNIRSTQKIQSIIKSNWISCVGGRKLGQDKPFSANKLRLRKTYRCKKLHTMARLSIATRHDLATSTWPFTGQSFKEDRYLLSKHQSKNATVHQRNCAVDTGYIMLHSFYNWKTSGCTIMSDLAETSGHLSTVWRSWIRSGPHRKKYRYIHI